MRSTNEKYQRERLRSVSTSSHKPFYLPTRGHQSLVTLNCSYKIGIPKYGRLEKRKIFEFLVKTRTKTESFYGIANSFMLKFSSETSFSIS